MTIISEEQAYLMGFSYAEDKTKPDEEYFHLLSIKTVITKEQLEWYKAANIDHLQGNRIVDFIRGFFDRQGKIHSDYVELPVEKLNKNILKNIDSCHEKGKWVGINAIEFLAFIYYKDITVFRTDNYNYFLQLLNPGIWCPERIPSFKWKKTVPNAVKLSKNRFSDTGYDITIVSKIKENNGVVYFDTGIQVEPENGYYFELVGRSSISKTGWMIANNIGIIDSSYRGNIIVALVKINKEAEEIKLPMRIAQLIPRQLIIMKDVEVNELNDTKRGSDGFGSSG